MSDRMTTVAEAGLDQEKVDALLARARREVDEGLLNKIFLLDQNIKNSQFVSENTLIEFHNLIDRFHKTCK